MSELFSVFALIVAIVACRTSFLMGYWMRVLDEYKGKKPDSKTPIWKEILFLK